MRLDRYLKETRIIKRRTLAKEMCEEGFVFVNGKKAKASHEVKPGEEIEVFFKIKKVTYRVKDIPQKGTPKSDSGRYYEVINESYYDGQ